MSTTTPETTTGPDITTGQLPDPHQHVPCTALHCPKVAHHLIGVRHNGPHTCTTTPLPFCCEHTEATIAGAHLIAAYRTPILRRPARCDGCQEPITSIDQLIAYIHTI